MKINPVAKTKLNWSQINWTSIKNAWLSKNFSFIILASFGIVILVILAALKVSPWRVLFAYLLGLPFAIIAVFTTTVIPNFIIKLGLKLTSNIRNKTLSKNFLAMLAAILFIGRYFLYVIPIIIVALVEKFSANNYFHLAGVLAIIMLVPLNSVLLNFLLFKIDLNKTTKKGVQNAATGDSLSPN